jgi:hypothetical protein
MKHALTIGCGSTNGKVIIDTLLAKNYCVTNIGRTAYPDVDNIELDWDQLQITNIHKLVKFDHEIDFVFFNHNSSSLAKKDFDFVKNDTLVIWKLIKDWQKTHWLSCQMPLLMLHALRKNLTQQTKIGFMLSTLIEWKNISSEQFPDYSSQKYFNYLAMRCLSEHYQSFGIMPDFSVPDSADNLKNIITQVCDQDVNGHVFKF